MKELVCPKDLMILTLRLEGAANRLPSVFACCYHGGAGPARTQGMLDMRRREFITLIGALG